ncbi:MAG: hypothetical protein OES79_08100, partial [Planctomycetota bacterium]|nr:hypothetical protein [Planctomycetota bacterium]
MSGWADYRWRKRAALWPLLMFVASFSFPCHAGTGVRVTAPHPKIVARNGLTLSVDPYWVEGRGYRPVRVVVNAVKAADYQRTIEIHLLASPTWRSTQNAISARRKIILPAGATTASAAVRLPQFQRFNTLSWTVTVNGVEAPELNAVPFR